MYRKLAAAAAIAGSIVTVALASSPATSPPVSADPMAALLASLTLEEKIDQMIMTYPPLAAEGPVTVGAIVLTGNLLKSEEAVRKRVADLQSRSKVPLLVAADVEGGKLNRLRFVDEISQLPAGVDFGRATETEARDWGRKVGKGMRSLGLNTSLAPVLDLAEEGFMFESGRSMGADPKRVATLGAAYAEGLWETGVVPIGKHFPGYGAIAQNSDHHLVIAQRTAAEIDQHATPFYDVGDQLGGVMLANVGYSAYGGVPAILSPELVAMAHAQGWLTVTDDLAIKALAESTGGSQPEVVRRAFLAGNDLLLTTAPIDWDGALDYRGIVLELVREDPSLEQRVDDSVRRILEVKRKAGLVGGPAVASGG